MQTTTTEMTLPEYVGFATMYMRMPMSTSTLPIQGTCVVADRRITLKFPFTGIEFDLPAEPRDQTTDFDFVIRNTRGSDMTVTISNLPELKAHTGVGREDDENAAVLTFFFFPPDSPLSKLPKL